MDRLIEIKLQIITRSTMTLEEIEHEIASELENFLFIDDVDYITVKEATKNVKDVK